MNTEQLKHIRKKIDEIDRQILELVAQRLKLAEKLAETKKNLAMEIRDKKREQSIIERAKKIALELGLDLDFVESLMMYIIANTAVTEKRVIRPQPGWEKIANAFKDYPAQLNVAKILFTHGLRIREDGEIACGSMRIPAVHVAEAAGVDRRVVSATAKRILENEELSQIFENLEPTVFLKNVAARLGLGVIEIIPEDAAKPGIIKEVTEVISKMDLSIRQAIADDPYLTLYPKLTIICDSPIPGVVIEELRKLQSVRSVVVY